LSLFEPSGVSYGNAESYRAVLGDTDQPDGRVSDFGTASSRIRVLLTIALCAGTDLRDSRFRM